MAFETSALKPSVSLLDKAICALCVFVRVCVCVTLSVFERCSSMLKAPVISSLETDFIVNALQQGIVLVYEVVVVNVEIEGVRVDGRTSPDFRAIKFEFGQKPGNLQVQIGQTRCVSGHEVCSMFALTSWSSVSEYSLASLPTL